MKKFVAFLLALIMCLSISACSVSDDSDNDDKNDGKTEENEENRDTFRKKEDFVGRWCMCQFIYDATGRIQSHEIQTLELNEDGSAELTVTTFENDSDTAVYNTTVINSWKYSKRKDLISFELDGEEKTYSVCRSEDGKDASLGIGYIPMEDDMFIYDRGIYRYVFTETFYRVNESCEVCSSLLAGKYMNEYGEITVSDEGYLIYNGEEYDLNGIPCYGPNHLRYIDGLVCICFVPEDNTIAISAIDEYTKLNGEYISFTDDNWTDYFSTNFYDTFEIVYKVNYGKDTWGDYQASVEYDYRLKDVHKYGEYTNVTVEYTFVHYVPVVMQYNTSTKKIVSVNVNYTPDYDSEYRETSGLRIGEDYEKPGCLEYVGSTSGATITDTNGDVITMEFLLSYYPTAINRMQGTLITAE